MYGRDVMKILSIYGCCRINYFSDSTSKMGNKSNIPIKALDDAKNFKISSYAQINTLDGLKKALYKFGPCFITFPLYNYNTNFWIPSKNNDKNISGNSTAFVGHAVTIVGYDDNEKHFIIRNSWGSLWGLGGYCYFPYDQFGKQWEIWSMVDGVSKHSDPKQGGVCVLL